MEKEKIERINYLARKSKTEGLSPEEKTEQQTLRDEYRAAFRRSFNAQLENVYVEDENGNVTSLSSYGATHEKEGKK